MMAAEQPSWLNDDPENPSAHQADNPFEVQFSYSSPWLKTTLLVICIGNLRRTPLASKKNAYEPIE